MRIQTIEKPDYCFPVALEPVFTRDGVEITKNRAVVRKDTNEPVSVVGANYNLIPHQRVFDAIRPYMERIGNYDEKFSVEKKGARVLTTFDFKTVTTKLQKGDVIGLRIIAVNTYDGTGALSIRVGGLVLKCLNGATALGRHFGLYFRHSGQDHKEIELPAPEVAHTKFVAATKFWNALEEVGVTVGTGSKEKNSIHKQVKDLGILSDRSLARQELVDQIVQAKNGWDLYNAYTWGITHTLKTKSITAQVVKTDRLNKVFIRTLGIERHAAYAM